MNNRLQGICLGHSLVLFQQSSLLGSFTTPTYNTIENKNKVPPLVIVTNNGPLLFPKRLELWAIHLINQLGRNISWILQINGLVLRGSVNFAECLSSSRIFIGLYSCYVPYLWRTPLINGSIGMLFIHHHLLFTRLLHLWSCLSCDTVGQCYKKISILWSRVFAKSLCLGCSILIQSRFWCYWAINFEGVVFHQRGLLDYRSCEEQ